MKIIQLVIIFLLSFSLAEATIEKGTQKESNNSKIENMDESNNDENMQIEKDRLTKKNKINLQEIISDDSLISNKKQILKMEKTEIKEGEISNSKELKSTELSKIEKSITLTLEESLMGGADKKITDDNKKQADNDIPDEEKKGMFAIENKFHIVDASKTNKISDKCFVKNKTETRFDRIEKILISVFISVILLIGFVLYDRFKRDGFISQELMQQINENKMLLKKMASILIEYSETEPDLEDIIKKEKLMQKMIQLD